MSPVEQTPRIGAQDEMTGIDPTLFSAAPTTQQGQPVEEKKNLLNLPPPSMAHMPMTAYFRPDDPQFLVILLEKKRQAEALSRRDSTQLVVLGVAYPQPIVEGAIALIAKDFLTALQQGNTCIASTEFKMLPPELQQAVLQEMLNQEGVDGQTGFSAQQKELRDFCAAVLPVMRQVTPEFQEQLGMLLVQHDPVQGILGSFERLQGAVTQFSQKMQDMFGVTNIRAIAQQIAFLSQALGKPELQEQFMQLCQLFDETAAALTQIQTAFDNGLLSVEELEENINTVTLTLDAAVQNFLMQFDTLTTPTEEALPPESPAFIAREVRLQLVHRQDETNNDVARFITTAYQKSAGKTIIKLDPEVYGLINSSLQRLKEQGEAVTLLPLMFCERQPVELAEAADLDFLKGSYEISNTQTLNNFSISIRYLYEQILQKDKAQRAENRDQLLKDLREVEKFLDELKEKIKTFYKRLSDIQQKNKLEKVYTAVAFYTQLIAALKAEQTGTKPFGQKPIFTVAWFEEALNTERWKKTVQVLVDITA